MPEPLFAYQETGSSWLAEKRNNRAGLFDEMGLGKSAQAIRALDKSNIRGNVLVVCPAAVRQVWVGEFRKFGEIPRRVLKGSTVQDLKLWQMGRVDVLAVSYEFASNHFARIGGDLISAIVFDEAHYLKNPKSQRTMRILGAQCDGRGALAGWGARVWFLTGTPNPNDAADIWSLLRFTGATTLDQDTFRARYYWSRQGAFSVAHEPRDERVSELRQAIRSVSLRRTLPEVGLDLPPLVPSELEVDGETAEVKALLAQYPGLDKAILEAIDKGSLSFLDAQHVATLRRLIGEAKAPVYADLLVEEFKNGRGKTVVFAIHKKVLDIVQGALEAARIGCVRLDGATSERGRVQAVESFQADPACRVFLANIVAAGVGITLTAAHDLDMLEQAWSPAGNSQAVKRVHRIGQAERVLIRVVGLANSFDAVVAQAVTRKIRAIAKVEGEVA
jgi:SWI/SNF-related matrix-associated actin-dependent regulator 1 of chromatin subfamily A